VATAGWLGLCLAASCLATGLSFPDPFNREMYNLKVDAIIAGVWIGLMGVNALPTAALVMMIGMNMMGSGGCRLFLAGWQ
jgi:hypothetical protein